VGETYRANEIVHLESDQVSPVMDAIEVEVAGNEGRREAPLHTNRASYLYIPVDIQSLIGSSSVCWSRRDVDPSGFYLTVKNEFQPVRSSRKLCTIHEMMDNTRPAERE